MSTFEIILRLLAATAIGGALGFNRELHTKPLGFRTLAIVGLGCAAVTLAGIQFAGTEVTAPARVIQGILTGIGFLGAGVIVHRKQQSHIKGLTTAAVVWLTACLGVACAIAQWRLIFLAALIGFGILLWGRAIENRIREQFGIPDLPIEDDPPK